MGTEHKIIKIIRIVLAIGAIAMIIGAITIFIQANNVRNHYVTTEAEIVKINEHISGWRRTHTVYVNYEYEDNAYENITYNSYNSSMRIGQTISIYVDPANPGDAKSGSYTPIMVLVPAAVLFLFLAKNLNKMIGGGSSAKTIKGLKESGQKIEALIENTEENQNIKINGKRPFRIHCRYDDPMTGNSYKFVSDNIYGFEISAFQKGDTICVYVDPSDYSKYYVEVSVSSLMGHL